MLRAVPLPRCWLRRTAAATIPRSFFPESIMSLESVDREIFQLIQQERQRQHDTLELIASENHVSSAVMEAAGSVLTNKYAEGYPGARYYQGCGFYDQVETLAIERAKQLFGCRHANVQAHSGANANLAAFMAMMNPGDQFISMNLASGGHLSHGMKLNTSAVFYKPAHYELDPKTEQIDFNSVRVQARELKPKMILCGYSAYPRIIDFAQFRAIADEVGALLMADIAHIAGLVAGGAHPSPFPHAHVVTTTTHKTLRGPRGGLILTNDDDLAKKINQKVFPGTQGGPLMHIIAAKAVAFGEDLRPEFKTYAHQIVKNAKALAAALTDRGHRLVSGGTDNHLMLVDLRARSSDLTGIEVAQALEKAGIICNYNGVPNDPRPPRVTSGIRLGTPALTTRGLKEADMTNVADFIDRAVQGKDDAAALAKIKDEVKQFAGRFPMPH
jgi:glycine hydroxymethyltransferase